MHHLGAVAILSIPSLKQFETPLKPGRSSEPRPEAVALTLPGSPQDPALDLLIRSMIAQLEFFQKQLAEFDAHIEKVFSRLEHRIKTIPGSAR